MIYNFNELNLIEGGASQKKVYRFKKKNIDLILLDFSKDIPAFKKHLEVYNILKNIDISIPRILEVYLKDYIIITEDFGDKRFDKVLNKYELKNLLKYAVESLIVIHNATINNIPKSLKKYNFYILKNEINEFIEYFLPYRKIDFVLNDEFFQIWKKYFFNLSFEFNAFVHKDYELINLLYLPKNKKYLKCGIIDFQNAYIGFKGWDLFSLLENSRIYFSNEINNKLIKYYYDNTYPNIDFDLFKKQYYYLNTSRQTRLLGRWIKFLEKDKNKYYLKFVDTTIRRLKESLLNLEIKELNDIYGKILK